MVVPLLLLGTLGVQLFAEPQLRSIEAKASWLAQRRRSVVTGAALLSIVGRLLLLPLAPVPIPSIHDEYSQLLACDTFAHGRLANPHHPMWLFFDTFHVLQHPTYSSIFPPATGAVLALGQLLGHPWIGVLLSAALMSSAIAWALLGWLPARWALLGSLLAILRVDWMSYWVDSYWGGTVAAIGGALVIGALPRLARTPTVMNSLLMGAGAALLANSRPVEGFLFCLGVGAIFYFRLFPRRSGSLQEHGKRSWLRRFLPAAVVLLCAVAFMGYYNWRVTGSALLFPHVLYHREHWRLGIFVWQKIKPPLVYDNGQFTQFFTAWNYTEFVQRSWIRRLVTKSHNGWNFFLGPACSIPLVMLPWLLRDRRTRSLCFLTLWCGVWALLVIWFEPHYIAGLTACLFVLLVQLIRHLRQWKFKGWPIGIFCSRLIVILALARVVTPGAEAVHPPVHGWNLARARIVAELRRLPRKSLVIVRYAPDHDPAHEWVYNAADIDGAKVIWAREIPGRDIKPLLDYFPDRQIWVVNADQIPVNIQPYIWNTGVRTTSP